MRLKHIIQLSIMFESNSFESVILCNAIFLECHFTGGDDLPDLMNEIVSTRCDRCVSSITFMF